MQIQQGEDDTTVFKTFTDQLVAGYSSRVKKLTYKTYPGVDHGGAVKDAKSAKDATSYIRSTCAERWRGTSPRRTWRSEGCAASPRAGRARGCSRASSTRWTG